MSSFLEFLKSDGIKKALFVLAVLAGALQQVLPPTHPAFQVASVVLAALAGLGIVSGGTTGTQPKTVVQVPVVKPSDLSDPEPPKAA